MALRVRGVPAVVNSAAHILGKPAPEEPRYTQEERDHAFSDAVALLKDSKVVTVLFSADVLSRRLYIIAREQLQRELTERWEVQNPNLVAEALVISAQARANDRFTAQEVLQGFKDVVLPLLEITAEAERKAGIPPTYERNDEQDLRGGENSAEATLGDVSETAGGDQSEQA
jgi:hypothetical protein